MKSGTRGGITGVDLGEAGGGGEMKFYIPSASPSPVDKTWSNSPKEIVEFTHYEIATDRFAFSLLSLS